MDPSGRVAVITGASSGIGLACARRLAGAGCAVVLGARRADRLDQAVRDIRAAGGRAESLVSDVTSEDDMTRLTAVAVDRFGGLDIMICNAGFGYYGTIEDTPTGTMQRMMDVNFMGTFNAARAAMPWFRTRGTGHLIIMSSIVGRRGIPLMSGYSASKAAQAGFAESLRSELAGTAIFVTSVYPVSTATEFRDAMTRDYGHSVSGLGPKQSADHVADGVLACIRRPRPELYPHRWSRGLTLLNAVVPGLTDRIVRRYGRRRDSVVAAARPETRFVRIPAGAFAMGSQDGPEDEAPVHPIAIDAFELAAWPVTRTEYAAFLAATRHPEPRDWSAAAFTPPNLPVVGVSWDDAAAYCAWCGDARLPTEAEWEWAARGGRDGERYPWGDDLPAWIPNQGRGPLDGPWPVTLGSPNGFGLFGIAANIHEWCADWYGSAYYAVSPAENPAGPATGSRRASRGGSWRHAVTISRTAARSRLDPSFRYTDYGFRVARRR